MKKIFFVFLMGIITITGLYDCHYFAGIRLIVQGDDMGFSHAANVGCIKSYQEGILRVVEVMVPCPWFPEAVEMLKENPGLDVGVHLTITSEWEYYKWGPLTHAPSLVDENGYFYPMVFPYENTNPERALSTKSLNISEIERELRAQIELAKKLIPHCSHVTGHMAFQELSPQIYRIALKLAKEYDLDANIRLFPTKYIDLFGDNLLAEDKINHAVIVLENLGNGTYLFVEHPGLNTPELQNVWDSIDHDVGTSRGAVTEALCSEKIKEMIKKKKIKLIGYKDM